MFITVILIVVVFKVHWWWSISEYQFIPTSQTDRPTSQNKKTTSTLDTTNLNFRPWSSRQQIISILCPS